MVTTLHLQASHGGEEDRGKAEAGTQLTYRAIDNLLPSQQNCIGEGREEGGGGGGGEGKKENPENSSLANVVNPSSRSSFALEGQRRKRTFNEKKQERSVAFSLVAAVI